MAVNWLDETKFTVGDEVFQAVSNLAQMREFNSSEGYVFSKTKEMLDRYCSYLSGIDIDNIFEIGIFRGGSVIFFNEYLNPKKIVAVECNSSCADLDSYIERKSLESTVVPYYNTNQADFSTLNMIVDTEFGDVLLDLVIDDASHLLEETRISFNTLFPKLKPGGTYVIEDWRWAHCQNELVLKVFKGQEPLTNIIFEAIMTCGNDTNIIDEIIIDANLCFIRRGSGYIDQKKFDIANSFYFMGKKQNINNYFSTLGNKKSSFFKS